MGKTKLNINQELFCQLYAGGKSEYFGNGVWCYILAYKRDVPLISYSQLNETQKKIYDKAKADASELLTKGNIADRCNELIDSLIKDDVVDRELTKVIMQNDELSAKVSAIKEYNQLKNRLKQPENQTVINIFSDEQAKEIARRISNDNSSGTKKSN